MFKTYFEDYKIELINMGLKKDDVVCMASGISGLIKRAKEEIGLKDEDRGKFLDEFINSCIDIIGPNGTLLIQSFTWDFCRGNGFDYYNSKSEVGALSNYVLENRKDFKRTKHPIYSFLVWGAKQDFFVSLDNQDAWGMGSPFAYFREFKAKQLLVACEPLAGMTFLHFVEQWTGVPYRHPKYFFGKYIDEAGKEEVRTYSMYVRDIDVGQDLILSNDFLAIKGVAKIGTFKDTKLSIVDMDASYPVIYDDIVNNGAKNVFTLTNYKLDFAREQTIPYEISQIGHIAQK